MGQKFSSLYRGEKIHYAWDNCYLSRWQWELAVCNCDRRWAQDILGIADRVAQVAGPWQLPYHCQTTTNLSETEAAARA